MHCMTQARNRLGACGCGKLCGEAVWFWEAPLHHPLECFPCLAKGHLFHLSCLGDGWSWIRDATSDPSLGCDSSGSWQKPGRCRSTQVVLHSPTVLIHEAELHKTLREGLTPIPWTRMGTFIKCSFPLLPCTCTGRSRCSRDD